MTKLLERAEAQAANTPEDATLRLSRTFAASRERVFDAFTQPDAIRAWWGPEDYVAPEVHMDVRPGGRFRFRMQPLNGDLAGTTMCGEYREVDRPARLSFTFSWEHEEGSEAEESLGPGEEMLVTVDFVDKGTATEIVLVHERNPSLQARDEHGRGWTSSMVCLGSYLRASAHNI